MKLYVARRANRIGLSIPMGQTGKNPNLLFPLLRKTDAGELDELIRVELEKQGITKESEVQAIVDKAEEDSEKRIKVEEARNEIRRLMGLRKQGAKLMQVGLRKWKTAFYPKG